MRSRLLPLLALACTLGVPAASHAGGSTFTPPAPLGATSVYCMAQNVGSTTATATAILHDTTGAVLGSLTGQIAPGQVTLLTGSSGAVSSTYCEFQGPSKSVRGFLSSQGGDGTVLPAGR